MCTVKRTILITGASSGIGLACVKNLLAKGHTVIGIARDVRRFALTDENFHPVSLDLSELTVLPERMREVSQQYPDLDAVIFSAGVGRFGSLEEFSYPQISGLMNINFISPVYLTRTLLPSLKQKNRSDLIFIGSEAALKGSRKGTVYCASKFALRGFTQALREECSKDNVRVCLINPGMVRTAFFDNLAFEPGGDPQNFLIPEDVADAVAYIMSARSDMIIDELTLNPASKVVKKK